MVGAAPRPRPQPPERVSPTLVGVFERCPLRAGFASDPRYQGLRRTGLRAALGAAAHAVAARSGTGAVFEVAWAEETARAMARLRADWVPATPPSVSSWPGSAITKARLRTTWEPGPTWPVANGPRVASTTAAGHKGFAGGHPPLPWRERWLGPPGTGLVGRPDLVERVDGVLRIVDLKTGVEQASMTEPQRLQLLFYCALVRHVLGELPTSAAVQRADGRLEEFAVNPSEVTRVELLALEVRQALDAAAKGAALEARPSDVVCSSCPFRVVCSAFLEAYQPEWRSSPVRLARIGAVVPADAHLVVDVEVVAPSWAAGPMRWVAFPMPQDLSPGSLWAASDFEGRTGTATARWNTLVAPWDGLPTSVVDP